jgi:hypothetical protein
MMEAASTSETSVNFYQTTWCYNLEDSQLHTCCRENLKSYSVLLLPKVFVRKKIEIYSFCTDASYSRSETTSLMITVVNIFQFFERYQWMFGCVFSQNQYLTHGVPSDILPNLLPQTNQVILQRTLLSSLKNTFIQEQGFQ